MLNEVVISDWGRVSKHFHFRGVWEEIFLSTIMKATPPTKYFPHTPCIITERAIRDISITGQSTATLAALFYVGCLGLVHYRIGIDTMQYGLYKSQREYQI